MSKTAQAKRPTLLVYFILASITRRIIIILKSGDTTAHLRLVGHFGFSKQKIPENEGRNPENTGITTLFGPLRTTLSPASFGNRVLIGSRNKKTANPGHLAGSCRLCNSVY